MLIFHKKTLQAWITHVEKSQYAHVGIDNRQSWGPDLSGTVARTGLSGVFIGNTAESFANSREYSVLPVKPDCFVSPLLRR
jgi:hypothetical protein